MADPKEFHFKLSPRSRPQPFQIADIEKVFPGVRDVMSRRSRSRPAHTINSITSVVIHATAGSSSRGAMDVLLTGRVRLPDGTIRRVKSSWHWLIPDENEAQHGVHVWACIFESLTAFHVLDSKTHPDVDNGRNRINDRSLGIEIVNAQGRDQFSDWQVRMTAHLVRFCWAKYPNLVNVVSHAKLDPRRRTDPGTHFPWARFEDLVRNGAFPDLEAATQDDPPLPRLANSEVEGIENLCCGE